MFRSVLLKVAGPQQKLSLNNDQLDLFHSCRVKLKVAMMLEAHIFPGLPVRHPSKRNSVFCFTDESKLKVSRTAGTVVLWLIQRESPAFRPTGCVENSLVPPKTCMG